MERDRLTIYVTTGNSSGKQSFKSQVGIGSRSHDFDADERIIFDISSFVAGFRILE